MSRSHVDYFLKNCSTSSDLTQRIKSILCNSDTAIDFLYKIRFDFYLTSSRSKLYIVIYIVINEYV